MSREELSLPGGAKACTSCRQGVRMDPFVSYRDEGICDAAGRNVFPVHAREGRFVILPTELALIIGRLKQYHRTPPVPYHLYCRQI